MTTVIPFLPSNIMAPVFNATLDGNSYKVAVTWNVSAQRYYINIYSSTGVWIITTALVSSPPARAVVATQYDPFLSSVIVTLVDPSQWPIPLGGPLTNPGEIVDYTLEGFQPNTYNGKFRCLHITNTEFTFPVIADPGPLVVLGRVSRFLNMVDTVFNVSSIIYRNGAFEINP